MSGKLPAIQFYPGDWRKDPGVQSLDYESRGIWFEILLIMFESEKRGKLALNGRPMEDDELAHYLGLEVAKVQQTLSKLVSKGVAKYDDEKYLMNRRMVSDDKLRLIRAQAGAEGGKQSASKRQANGKQNPTPSSSVSVSTAVTTSKTDNNMVGRFEQIWDKYPNRDGRKAAERHFKASVKTDADFSRIKNALENYLKSAPVLKGFVKNGSTWFNNWQDWENAEEKKKKVEQLVAAFPEEKILE